MTPIQRFKKLIQIDKKDISQIFLYAIFAGIISLSLPLGIQSIINFIQAGKISTSWIILVFFVILGVTLVGVLKMMQYRISENWQQKIFVRAAFEFSYRFPQIKQSQFRDSYPPELANRFFDTLSIQKGASKLLLEISAALLQIAFGIILLSIYHSFFLFFGIILAGLLILNYKINFEKGLQTSLKESKYKYKVAHWIQEIARNHLSFKENKLFQFGLQKNDTLVNEYLLHREKHFKVLRAQFIQLIGFKIIITAGLLIAGGLFVINGSMNIGQFVASEIVILSIVSAVEKLFSGLELFYDVLTSVEKIGEISDMEIEQHEMQNNALENQDEYSLEIKNIHFQYPNTDTPIIHDFSLQINPKDRVLIEGKNGSGKTTLLRILARILEPISGTILLNKVNFKRIALDEYRNQIGVITLDETPFNGTILENITCNDPNIKLKDVEEVLTKLKALDTIKMLPNGMHTHIFPEARQINSSIAQKIILARCLIKNPKILFLEEPVNKLENEKAIEIIDYLTSEEHDWVLVVIAKDPYWKSKCNKVITLN